MSDTAIRPAFRDPVGQSQAAFRTVMDAVAHPGRILPLDAGFAAPAPLTATAAAILLTLADYETPIWLDVALAAQPGVAAFLRFHTGARLAASPDAAAFAVIADMAVAPPLTAFAQGTPEYPDRSTTLILQVETLTPAGWTLTGPGIKAETAFGAAPVPAGLAAQLADNRGRFPMGVDIIFAAPGSIAALPRSTWLMEAR
jgi:alpha-D-ribose 1-methylphosphonate 5-triphosphate synthase subunit PhnH